MRPGLANVVESFFYPQALTYRRATYGPILSSCAQSGFSIPFQLLSFPLPALRAPQPGPCFLPASSMKRLHIQQIPAAARKGRAVLLKIEGELVADNVPTVHQLLLGVLPEAKSVRLVLHEVECLDLAFVQLLWSARRTATALGKNFTVEATLPDELQSLLQTAGFDTFPQYAHQPAPAPSHA